MNNKIDVSIIIVSYNTKKLTLETLNSVYEKTTNLKYEAIVVDNNSQDDTVTEIKKHYPSVQVIENSSNLGFGAANNIGSKVAKGKYLFFLNSDTILINNAIKKLFNFLENNANIGAVGGNLYFKDATPTTSMNRLFPGVLSEIDNFFFNLPSNLYFKKNVFFNYSNKPLIFKGNISGADLMINKKLFEEINGFDKDFFMYYEETELLYRICKKNYKVALIPDAKIIHLEGASENKKDISHRRSFNSKWKYLKKTNKSRLIPLIHFLFQITAFQRKFLFFILGRKNKVRYWNTIQKIESISYKEMLSSQKI